MRKSPSETVREVVLVFAEKVEHALYFSAMKEDFRHRSLLSVQKSKVLMTSDDCISFFTSS